MVPAVRHKQWVAITSVTYTFVIQSGSLIARLVNVMEFQLNCVHLFPTPGL